MTVATVNVVDLPPLDISTLKFIAEQFDRLCEANPDALTFSILTNNC